MAYKSISDSECDNGEEGRICDDANGRRKISVLPSASARIARLNGSSTTVDLSHRRSNDDLDCT